MKKLALLIATALAFTGLVATSGSASAAPYPGTVKTHIAKVHAPKKIKKGHRPTVHTKVVAKSGNAKPKGKVTLIIKKGKRTVKKVVRAVKKGGKVAIKLPKLAKGHYKLTIKFTPKKNSAFKPTTKTVKLTVTKKKKHHKR